MKRVVILTALSLAWLSPGASASSATITISRDATTASSANRVDILLQNESDHDIYLIGYLSALTKPEGRTTGNWLRITDSFGREVPYVGRYVRNGAFSPSAFMKVPVGGRIEGSVDLAREYDLPPAGEITVSTTISVHDRVARILPSGENESIPSEVITSNELTFPVIGGYMRDGGVASTLKCAPAQLDMTRRAISAAMSASNEAVNFVGSLYYSDPIDPANPVFPRFHMRPHFRYTNWFGTWDDSAPQEPDPGASDTDNTRVDQTLAAIYVRLMSGARTVCDECKGYDPSARAWAEGSLIHLCPVNFSDPITGGITSQAGTIVHEVSHRNDSYAEGTVDIEGVRSRDHAHRLSRPQAVRSAANYEYFITDTPLGR